MQVTREWDSMAEFVDYCAGATDYSGTRASRGIGDRWGSNFHATHSFPEAQAIAFNWPEGARRIESIRARVALKNQRARQVTRMREAGPGVVSMGAFMAGHPQPFATREADPRRTRKGKGKVVRIVLNAVVSSGVSRRAIEQRGGAVLALADALTQAGRQVEIQVGMANRVGVNAIDYMVTVKKAEQRLNLNSVAFAIANADMLRRFFLSAMEMEKQSIRKAFKVGVGYGLPGDFTNLPEDVIYLGGASIENPAWRTDEATRNWIAQTLETQGVAVKG